MSDVSQPATEEMDRLELLLRDLRARSGSLVDIVKEAARIARGSSAPIDLTLLVALDSELDEIPGAHEELLWDPSRYKELRDSAEVYLAPFRNQIGDLIEAVIASNWTQL